MNEIDDLMKTILTFRNKRNWKQFHTPENLAKSIAIESGELLENFQWGDAYGLDDVKDELADVLIYAFLMAEAIDADIEQIIKEKVAKNEHRFPVERVKGNSGKYTKVD